MRRSSVRVLAIALLAVFALVASGCSGGGEGEVKATLSDFNIDLDSTSVSADENGAVTFKIHNDGPSTHEFVVFDTSLAADQLPTDENGDVDEEGSEDISVVDEVEDVEDGADETLSVNLAPGTYVIVCNLPGHYGAGMHTTITVE